MRVTKGLITCGVLTGPIFFGVAILQIVFRPGYNIFLNAISQLSLGDLGWIQITSFILTGLLAIAGGIGVRRLLKGKQGGTWGAILMCTFGLGLIVAGIFPPDPGNGFPPGTPAGTSSTMSVHADLHALGFFISMISAIANCFVFVRRYATLGKRGWLTYCIISGVAAPILIALTNVAMSMAGVIVALAGAVVFGWATATSVQLKTEAGA